MPRRRASQSSAKDSERTIRVCTFTISWPTADCATWTDMGPCSGTLKDCAAKDGDLLLCTAHADEMDKALTHFGQPTTRRGYLFPRPFATLEACASCDRQWDDPALDVEHTGISALSLPPGLGGVSATATEQEKTWDAWWCGQCGPSLEGYLTRCGNGYSVRRTHREVQLRPEDFEEWPAPVGDDAASSAGDETASASQ